MFTTTMESYTLEWLSCCLGKPFGWLIGISPISFADCEGGEGVSQIPSRKHTSNFGAAFWCPLSYIFEVLTLVFEA